MSILDILFLTIIISLIITTIFINMVLYQLWHSIRNMRKSTERVFAITQGILSIQRKAKLAMLKPLYNILSRLKK